MKLKACERCGKRTAEGLALCPDCMKESGAGGGGRGRGGGIAGHCAGAFHHGRHRHEYSGSNDRNFAHSRQIGRWKEQMKIERQWAMPNKWTFRIKPIKELLMQEITDGLWVDPYAGECSPATITNDLNPERPTDYHLQAIDFLKKFKDKSVDGVLYDPPYSQRQVKECYDGIGIDGWDGRMTFWSEAKNEIARIVKPGGKVICFGWNSMGCGAKRGFSMGAGTYCPARRFEKRHNLHGRN